MKFLPRTLCVLVGVLSSIANAADDTDPKTYTSACSEAGTELSCLTSIDTNAGQDNYNSTSIYDLLKDNFAFGSSAFYGSSTPSDDSAKTDLTSSIQDMEYSVVSSGFSTNFLPWLMTSSSAQTLSAVDTGSDSDDSDTDGSNFTSTVNTISSNHNLYGGGQGTSGLASSDYYSAASSYYNSGTGQIEYFDLQPYTFPPSSRIIRDELGQISMTQFLENVGLVSSTSVSDDMAKDYQSNCPQYQVSSEGYTYYGLDGQSSCLSPYIQMNVSSYNSSGSYKPDSGSSYSLDVPNYDQFFKGNIDSAVLPSLSVDSLVSPLTYSNTIDSTLSSDQAQRHEYLGLYGDSQLGMADSFVRYVSGSLLPNNFATRDTYDTYYTLATSGKCLQYRLDAALKIKTYRQLLRYYAAQKSVGASNLYYLMAKRMPNSSTDQSRSQAEEEARMATYRIFPTTSSDGKTTAPDWQKRLQQASGAEIQRQIAVLLAEINYQLYLTRKEQERILMTMSVMQLDSINQNKQSLNLDTTQAYVSSISATSTNECGQASAEVSGDDD